MSAWGYGLLQNDSAQDGLVTHIDGIASDAMRCAGEPPSDEAAARLGAAVWLLLQLDGWHCFDGTGPDTASGIGRAVERQRPCFAALSPAARQLLEAVAEGRGSDLCRRHAELPSQVRRALYSEDPPGGEPMERGLGGREPSLFEHPAANAYVLAVAERLMDAIDADFGDEEIVTDLSRESFEGVAGLAVLLVVAPRAVPSERVRAWREAFRAAQEEPSVAEEDERAFDLAYAARMELALSLLESGESAG